jgi:hypothetical protein
MSQRGNEEAEEVEDIRDDEEIETVPLLDKRLLRKKIHKLGWAAMCSAQEQ